MLTSYHIFVHSCRSTFETILGQIAISKCAHPSQPAWYIRLNMTMNILINVHGILPTKILFKIFESLRDKARHHQPTNRIASQWDQHLHQCCLPYDPGMTVGLSDTGKCPVEAGSYAGTGNAWNLAQTWQSASFFLCWLRVKMPSFSVKTTQQSMRCSKVINSDMI